MDAQLVVLGGGPGGYAAAFLAADLGMSVTLVEQESRLGGVCLLRGCIPSKALLHVARAIADMEQLAEWGVEFGKPSIDLDAVRSRKEKVIETLTGGLKQLAAKRKVKVVQARATFEDSRTLRLDAVGKAKPESDRLRFEHCIIASGSRAATIPSFDIGSERVMNSKVALDLPEIPKRLLVIGGGYIGLEMGSVYAALGSQVSVVEMTDGLLPGADRDLVRPLQKRLEERFDAIYLGTKVAGMTEVGKSIEVTFEGGVEAKIQRFDRVLISVGRKPNSDNLGLENTAVKVDGAGFIVVDNRGRTSDDRILAIGDVAGQPMLAHKAAHQGRAAVEALAGEPAVFEPRAIPAVVFTDPEVAWAGLTETEAKQQGLPV
ncbi:MAG: FAD-dependent oxidoreductase, partial [Patescibacteria group bacterium]|nr:FAD-dependent oxidoreductase [Patescibacteria group bacterium]